MVFDRTVITNTYAYFADTEYDRDEQVVVFAKKRGVNVSDKKASGADVKPIPAAPPRSPRNNVRRNESASNSADNAVEASNENANETLDK
jgi:hypothetical protein